MKASAAIRFEFQSRRCRCKTLSEVSSRSGKNCFYSVPTWPTFFFRAFCSSPNSFHNDHDDHLAKTRCGALHKKKTSLHTVHVYAGTYPIYRRFYRTCITRFIRSTCMTTYLMDRVPMELPGTHAVCVWRTSGGKLTVLLTKDCAHGGIHRWATR